MGLVLVVALINCMLPGEAGAEGAIGRVTFVGTLGEERLSNGSVQARFRFRVSESTCNTTEGIWTTAWQLGSWSPWQPLPSAPVPLVSDPAPVPVGQSQFDVFARGSDGRMYSIRWDSTPGSAPNWSAMGSELFSSGPAAVFERGNNWIHVFARGQIDGALWGNHWRGSWSGWRQILPNRIDSDPAAVSWGQNRIDVFARGTNSVMHWTSSTNGGFQWSGWVPLGSNIFDSNPGASSGAPNRIELFSRDAGNRLHMNVLIGTAWSGWRAIALSPLASGPAVVSTQPSSYVYAKHADNKIYVAEIRTDGAVVAGWSSVGGSFAGGPAVVSTALNQVRVFARARSRAHRWFHVRSGPIDTASQHNAVNFRNAYNTLLSGFLARTVSIQVTDPTAQAN